MNDNYLWDRTGTPDAEVQELEELLGTLQYQPRPLEIPATIKVRSNRMVLPLAIAAAIALTMMAAALWIHFAKSQVGPVIQATRQDQPIAPSRIETPLPSRDRLSIATIEKAPTKTPRHPKTNPVLVATNKHSSVQIREAALTPQELAEKEQVLVALRLLSAKLNLVQRKSQGLPQVNAIRNQHKMG
jgi:hypothetical protein